MTMAKLSGNWIRRVLRIAIYLRDEFQCVYCQKNMHRCDPFDITLDHLVPRSLGGTHNALNLVTACRSCNSSKQAKDWHKWASRAAKARIRKQLRRKLPIALAKSLIEGQARRQQAKARAR